ncbi:NAD(P)/FAD-dependent oxidoreductase [Frigidibacter sp. MR17.24]|uniref:NAD(P)/FAD-dependent oxidoreductase n=1 Tax=Frigidibacter sp. MR17.24 TaxID=3127345 RepID=UPI003012FE9C
MDETDCVVIGAGVVGLAVARELARAGHEVVVLEKADAFGTETSARNSEVIHAGIYYPAGSIRARLCIEGKARLYAFCAEHGVGHRNCGKLVVATDPSHEAALDKVMAHAAACGVTDLRRLPADEAMAMEPDLFCTSAVLSPSTGIIDSHGYMLALVGEIEAAGGMLALGTTVLGGRVTDAGIELRTADAAGAPFPIRARRVVNAAGLWAAGVAAAIEGLPARDVPKMHYARGNYFTTTARHGFGRLIYPVPEPGGLGVHLTLDLAGGARFGPDVEWIDGVDYTLSDARAGHFEREISRYWPGLPKGSLSVSYCGVRPKLSGPGAPAEDFRIHGPAEHGVPGLVNLYGIESPGLTSSLALAAEVAARLG